LGRLRRSIPKMRLTIACFTPATEHAVCAEFNNWLPPLCCAAGCDKPAVYKLRGRVPPKDSDDPDGDDWLCFEIGLTLCEEHEQTDLPSALMETRAVRDGIRRIARTMDHRRPDMDAVEVAMIPFAAGSA
jgi:hypothetical protein